VSDTEELTRLRERAARLQAENLQLKGAAPAAAGRTALERENAQLRRDVEQLRARMPKATFSPAATAAGRGPDTHLTIHEVAGRLNTTAREARAMLAGRLPIETDANGMWVVRRADFEQAVVDMSRRRDPSRFL
jgi:hypothetical protein